MVEKKIGRKNLAKKNGRKKFGPIRPNATTTTNSIIPLLFHHILIG